MSEILRGHNSLKYFQRFRGLSLMFYVLKSPAFFYNTFFTYCNIFEIRRLTKSVLRNNLDLKRSYEPRRKKQSILRLSKPLKPTKFDKIDTNF